MKYKQLYIYILFLIPFNSSKAQLNLQNIFDSTFAANEKYILKISKSANSLGFTYLCSIVDGLSNAYLATGDSKYREKNIALINNIISTASPSYRIPQNRSKSKDDYSGWTSRSKNYSLNEEVILYEGYLMKYIANFIFILKNEGFAEKSIENKSWYQNAVNFLENNIWEKWTKRSLQQLGNQYTLLITVRTHMGSHWAYFARVLYQISSDTDKKDQYSKLYDYYDLLLKRNLIKDGVNGYIWNSTWDNTENTPAPNTTQTELQDVSHGNHVISYIVFAHTHDPKAWTNQDIEFFANTIKKNVYDPNTQTFADMLDKTPSKNQSRIGWGNFQADGWIKLSRYDNELEKIYEGIAINKKETLVKYKQELQYIANLMYAQKLAKN